MIVTLILTCFIGFLLINLLKQLLRIKEAPPGPWGVPILGYYPFLGSKPQSKIAELSEKYGEIMSINFFGDYYYFLNSYDLVKQALVEQSNYTFDRPPKFGSTSSFGLAYGPKCLVTCSGNEWKNLRSFMLNKLFTLGFGKTEIEDLVLHSCEKLVDYIKNTDGNAFDVYEYFTNFTSNVISALLYSRMFEHDDPLYTRMRDYVRDHFAAAPGIESILSGTWYNIANQIKGDCYKRQKEVKKRFEEYFLPIIEERLKQRQSNRSLECNDLMDYFIEHHLKNPKEFETETISANCFMWFVGGSESAATTLYHAINLLILYPEIQKKVRQEIDSVFGCDRRISYQERHLLPYTQAVIEEVARFSCIAPFAIIHSNSAPITVVTKNRTYVIPEKSCIVPHIKMLCDDPKYFPNPDVFNPNHFLNEKGEFVKNEANIPFSTGKRMCIAAPLAATELFIAFVALFQKFEWKSSNDAPVPRIIVEVFSRHLLRFTARAVPRN